jgi:hypothetical protein
MQYVMLICSPEEPYLAQSPEEQAEGLSGYIAFGEEMGKRGVLNGGARLRPTTDATTVRVSNGEIVTSDGPFAETKEQIGGFYLVEAKDLDEAIEIASKIPAAKDGYGSVEVRPVWE